MKRRLFIAAAVLLVLAVALAIFAIWWWALAAPSNVSSACGFTAFVLAPCGGIVAAIASEAKP